MLINLNYGIYPTESIFDLTPLDTGQEIVQLLSQLTGLEIGYSHNLTAIVQLADGEITAAVPVPHASSKWPVRAASISSLMDRRRSSTS